MCRRAIKQLFLLALIGFPALAFAQPPVSVPDTQAQIAALQQAVRNAESASESARSAGDNAWMLISAALVLLMTCPGLTLFYGGLVRKKNILGTMMQSLAMMGLVTVLWALVGYSLAFGHGNSFIGGFEHVFLRGVGLTPNANYGGTIPEQTFMVYQLMFAIITPALITGAFAERVKFSAMVVFLCLWSLMVYCPMAHMVWGVGGLLALWYTGTNFSVSSGLGFVALMGVAVLTSVILYSFINKLRLEGKDIVTATYEASLLRLRPIMMTALVACIGLLPAATSTGIGSDSQKPFAIVIVGGLLSRLLLSIFLAPVLYAIVARRDDVLKV